MKLTLSQTSYFDKKGNLIEIEIEDKYTLMKFPIIFLYTKTWLKKASEINDNEIFLQIYLLVMI